jgi:phosphoglycolate phosphatase-like HAD superfamily hydrolase
MIDAAATPRVSVLVTDLDNTLFDWLGIWYRSFSAMLDRLVADSGVPRSVLEAELREIHQRHGTPEYAFSIEELPSLRAKHPGEDPARLYEAAIAAFRNARREARQLYPTVLDTLHILKNRGCMVVAYTESMAFYAHRRMRHLGLDLLIDYVYSPADHDLPAGLTAESIRRYPPDAYRLRRTVHRHTPAGERKPSRWVLAEIVSSIKGRSMRLYTWAIVSSRM